ncbi:hypothetical protein UY3_01573 [Chelonia mydas]|uniref:Uncharacterized protein n=1 Tax=Chelonia mydas TaxID=8469 RepID=M7BZ49_CHEMY|nr:hypothetical protein UY3_01573 [Chelonia mydas]
MVAKKAELQVESFPEGWIKHPCSLIRSAIIFCIVKSSITFLNGSSQALITDFAGHAFLLNHSTMKFPFLILCEMFGRNAIWPLGTPTEACPLCQIDGPPPPLPQFVDHSGAKVGNRHLEEKKET